MNSEIRKTLEAVKNGELSVDDALLAIKKEPFEDIGYAKVDLHRGIRQGAAEVIYGAGKTPEQMVGIIGAMLEHEVKTILLTRLSEEKAAEIRKHIHRWTIGKTQGLAPSVNFLQRMGWEKSW